MRLFLLAVRPDISYAKGVKAGSKRFGSMFLGLCASIGCAGLVHAQALLPVTCQGPVSLVTTGSVTYAEYSWVEGDCLGLFGIGPVIRNGNNFSYNLDLGDETGVPCDLLIFIETDTVALGTLAPGDYTLTTTSWNVPVATNTFTVPTNSTPMFQPIGFDTNGAFNIQLTGVPNVSYVLQCSTNLVDWTSLTTNSVGPPLRDISPILPGPRFYRVQIVNLTIPAPVSPPEAILVGEWFAGATNLTDVSGYSPAGTHDGYTVGGGNYVFTNDVPFGKSGQSLFFYNGDTGLAISNSSTLDASYTNTFDDTIHSAMTVSFWAKGLPGGWNPWVSKWGDFVTYPDYSTTSGWQLRQYGSSGYACFTVRDNNAGGLVFGNASFDLDDLASTYPSNDGGWHNYAGTFNANTGVRNLIVDGMLAAKETNNVAYQLAPFSHLVIGGKDSPPGNNFGNFSTFEIYDVRIYNAALY